MQDWPLGRLRHLTSSSMGICYPAATPARPFGRFWPLGYAGALSKLHCQPRHVRPPFRAALVTACLTSLYLADAIAPVSNGRVFEKLISGSKYYSLVFGDKTLAAYDLVLRLAYFAGFYY